MDKYSSFEIFMIEVVNKANSISDLNELFGVTSKSVWIRHRFSLV